MIPSWHDFFIGYDPVSKQDRFYGGGWQSVGPQGGAGQLGYYVVYDVTNPAEPKVLTTVTGVSGVDYAHTFVPTPDGRYVIAESEHQYQPLKIFDLKPGLDGTVKTISRPISAWTPNWNNLPHQMEMRWPYMFVASLRRRTPRREPDGSHQPLHRRVLGHVRSPHAGNTATGGQQ